MSFEKRNPRMHKAIFIVEQYVALMLFKVIWFPLVANSSNPLWHGIDHDDNDASHYDYSKKKVDASLELGF
jgi:hypothetical protein